MCRFFWYVWFLKSPSWRFDIKMHMRMNEGIYSIDTFVENMRIYWRYKSNFNSYSFIYIVKSTVLSSSAILKLKI